MASSRPRVLNGSDAEDMSLGEATMVIAGICCVIGACTYYCCGCCFPCCCLKRCRRTRAAPDDPAASKQEKEVTTVQVDGAEVKLEHLRQRKDLSTAYILWSGAGLFGAHHFYLDRVAHGMLATSTMNFLSLGWMFDALALPVYVRSFNAKLSPAARCDGSKGRLCCRLPLASTLWLVVVIGFYLLVPRAIHTVGLVDIDAAVAETKSNPYVLLRLEPNASYADAQDALARETIRLQRDCPTSGKGIMPNCQGRQKELKKAYAYIVKKQGKGAEAPFKKNRQGKKPSDFENRIDDVVLEWKALGNYVYAKGQPSWDSFRKWAEPFFGNRQESEESPFSDL